jgi:large subunit ribosomal protein L32e
MAEIQRLLEVRKQMNRKRPYFVRQETYLRLKLEHDQKWRRAKGKHSKMREGRVSHKASVQAGYRGPALVRGLNLLGQKPVLIHNVDELSKLNSQNVAIVSSTVGLRHKIEIAKKAKEMNLKTNLKLDKLEARLAAMRQKTQEKKAKSKTETKSEKPAKTEKKDETLAQKLGEATQAPASKPKPAKAVKTAVPAEKKVESK